MKTSLRTSSHRDSSDRRRGSVDSIVVGGILARNENDFTGYKDSPLEYRYSQQVECEPPRGSDEIMERSRFRKVYSQ